MGETDSKEGDEDAWAKLGDTISSYFGAKEGEEKKDGDEKEKIDLNEGKSGKKDKKKKDKKDKKKEKKEEKKPPVKKEFKPIVETIKEPLEFKLELVDFADLSNDQYVASKKKLKILTIEMKLKLLKNGL